jgi:SCP-2 sterol transfer family
MAVDVQQLFNVELPAQLAKFPDAAKQIGATFQLNITGEGGGWWFIDVSSTGPSVVAGEKPADCTITLTSEAFGELLANPQANGERLFFSGALTIAGNTMLAQKLSKLFNLGWPARQRGTLVDRRLVRRRDGSQAGLDES